jgi:GNAT superfamily N-acetyltransferase
MTLLDWRERPISKTHDRASFDCGVEELNVFLQRHARQNHEVGSAKTFVATPLGNDVCVWGFYSLSPAAIRYAHAPALVKKGLARHDVPVFRLGRLAVDRKVQGRGLGGQLLLAAGRRCLFAAAEVGGVALLIDAKNEPVSAWYQTYGALPLADMPLTLLLPLATIQAALERQGSHIPHPG